jgi:lipoyl synthase
VALPAAGPYRATEKLLRELGLHSVCEEARCPNKGECFSSGTATFLILGDVCTRACAYCSVRRGNELAPPDGDEPGRVGEAAARLGLNHVVVTSVTRDDLEDGGSDLFAATVEALRDDVPDVTVEVLVPDFKGDDMGLWTVLGSAPHVFNHNIETVPRLFPSVRPQASYQRSMRMLAKAARWASAVATRPVIKTGFMVGLGEDPEEVDDLLVACAEAGIDVVTIGQYLRPARRCMPVARYVEPGEFEEWRQTGESLGLETIAAPFVRSSYKAGQHLRSMTCADLSGAEAGPPA